MFFQIDNPEECLRRLKQISKELSDENQTFFNEFLASYFDHPISSEFHNVVNIVQFGKNKYGHTNNNILTTERTELYENHASMSRHLAQGFCGIKQDPESGLSPFAHLATRAMVSSYRSKKGNAP